jgi:hypothetical protein
MKNKISLIIIGLFLVLGVTAQRAVLLSPNLTYQDVRVTAADVATTTGTLTFSAEVNQHVPFSYDVNYELSKIGTATAASTASVTLSLTAKKFLNSDPVEVASATWNDSTVASVTGTFSTATNVRYRYLFLTLTGTNTNNVSTGVTKLEWKIWQ